MKTFFRLMRFQERTTGLLASLKFMARSDPKEFKKNITVLIVLAVALAPMYGLYLITAGSITAAFAALEMQRALFTLAFTAFCAVGLVFGLFSMISRLFLCRDNEFYAMLPVKQSTVYAVKVTRLYITQLIFAFLFLTPITVCYGLTSGDIPAIFIGFLMILIIPSVPLLIASLLSVLFMPLTAYAKNRERAAMIISTVFMLLIVTGQMLLSRNMPEEIDQAYIMALLQGNSEFINSLSGIFPPAAWMACAVTGTQRLLNLALSVLTAVGGGFLAWLIAGRLYYRGMQAQLEGHRGKHKKAQLASRSSAVAAVFKKEWRVITKTPVYAMNALSGAVVLPLMCIIIGLSSGDRGSLRLAGEVDIWLAALIAGAFMGFMGTINTGGATMITREGKSFFVLKMIPVDLRTVVKGKLLCSLSINLISILPSAIIIAVLFISPVSALAAFVIAMLIGVSDSCICMLFDCYRPKLDWSSPQVAIKQTLNSGMCMLVSMALIVALSVVGVLMGIALGAFAAAATIIVLLAVSSAVLCRLAVSKGAAMLQKING
ncbi:MAG: hypothetical protein PUC05_08620 [Firmicutes bacterium]|nr:hypothetical protein [Bacillota bacterium]